MKGEVGFLAEHRRINVAITRARRHLAVIADSETVSNDDFLKSLMEYMASQGEVRSAHEYIQDSFPTVDASSYHYERHEMFIKGKSKDYKNKKEVKAKNGKSKDRVPLNASVSDNVNKERDYEAELGTVCNGNAEERDQSLSSHTGVISTQSSPSVDFKSSDDYRQLPGPSSGDTTVTAKYSRETLEKEIVNFTQDKSQNEFSFPKTLNSQQRFDVHSIAEELGLDHESIGEGKGRYIVVRKPPESASKGGLTCCIINVFFTNGDRYLGIIYLYPALVFTKSVYGDFRTFGFAPVIRNILGYSLFWDRSQYGVLFHESFRRPLFCN